MTSWTLWSKQTLKIIYCKSKYFSYNVLVMSSYPMVMVYECDGVAVPRNTRGTSVCSAIN